MPAPAATLEDAWQHHRAGRTFEAASLAHQILNEEPRQAAARHLVGIIALGLGDARTALDWLGQAVAEDGGVARYHDDLGRAYRALDRDAEAETSHRRALALAPDSPGMHVNLGLALRGQGRLAAAAAAFGRALALEPDHPHAHFHLGNLHAAAGARSAAIARYRAAIAGAPGFVDAHINLGSMLHAEERYAEARHCYRAALALDPSNAAAHNNLGNSCERQGDFAAAAAGFARAIALDPRYVAPRINLGNLRLEGGDFLSAVECYRTALTLAPDHAEAHQNYGLVRLMLGDFAGGWREWRWPHPAMRRFRQPEWRGEPLHGETILLHAEQGFGDTLHFVRYVPLVAARGGRVILEVPAEMKRLLARIPGADRILACGETLPDFAWQCSLLSLPLAFGTELATIPAQVPYIDAVPAAPPPPTSGLRVGLVWAGRPQHNRDRHRSLPLAALAPLGRVPGVGFEALQKGPAAAEAARDGAPLRLVDTPGLDDWTDTAQAIAALDLVVGVDTAVAHLAGAMGKPVWLLLSHVPDWRWLLGRADSPWYPTARLFRQKTPGDWAPVIADMAAALAAHAALR